MSGDAAAGTLIEVVVRHNLVHAVRRVARDEAGHVPGSRLEVGTQLARNHQARGCIDGCYRFEDAEQARSFALLAMDFVKRLAQQRMDRIQALDSGAEFDAGGDGDNTG